MVIGIVVEVVGFEEDFVYYFRVYVNYRGVRSDVFIENWICKVYRR